MTKSLAQIAYEARFEHLPPRDWTPWDEMLDPVARGIWAKVGLAVQMAVTERMAMALKEHTRSYLFDKPVSSVYAIADAMSQSVPARYYGGAEDAYRLIDNPPPDHTDMKPLDLAEGPPLPLGIDPSALTRLDLEQMREAGLIKSWTEDNDTGAYRIEFLEPLPELKLATTPAMQQHIEALVEGMAKEGEKS